MPERYPVATTSRSQRRGQPRPRADAGWRGRLANGREQSGLQLTNRYGVELGASVQLDLLGRLRDAAARSLERAKGRYLRGLDNYLSLLDSQRSP
ncbi:hypothetical protein [Pseudomonas oryzihabitans]|uniref:hypothetical protein n=1 Tax=Pseudomonas oryzihabitans TaxID=47885 RepID=UPI0028940A74|nr:hypothetical protein [Pseudomonas oryzihabitans]MDT3718269.1 hypothetical protein [Pseudomonas oryzihabitans]